MNYGFTTIDVRGPEGDRTELWRELAATSRGELEFTLVAAAPEVWRGDKHLNAATIRSADGVLGLHVCLPWDQDALRLCGSLSRRYPSLVFDGCFHCEGTWPGFTLSCHRNGVVASHAHFDVQFIAYLLDGQSGKPGRQLGFYQKTPERDAAALDSGPGEITAFLARPPVAGGWRRSDHDAEAGTCYLRGAESGEMTVLVLQLDSGEGHVLSGVDAHCGYQACETLGLDQLRSLFPELSGEFAIRPEPARAVRKPAIADDEPGRDWDVPF